MIYLLCPPQNNKEKWTSGKTQFSFMGLVSSLCLVNLMSVWVDGKDEDNAGWPLTITVRYGNSTAIFLLIVVKRIQGLTRGSYLVPNTVVLKPPVLRYLRRWTHLQICKIINQNEVLFFLFKVLKFIFQTQEPIFCHHRENKHFSVFANSFFHKMTFRQCAIIVLFFYIHTPSD